MHDKTATPQAYFNVYYFQATGAQLGVIVSAISSVGSALIIAFYFGWKLAFVVVAFLPLIVLSGAIQARLMTGSARKDKESMEEGAGVSCGSHFSLILKFYILKQFLFAGCFRSNRVDSHSGFSKQRTLFYRKIQRNFEKPLQVNIYNKQTWLKASDIFRKTKNYITRVIQA